MKKNIITLGVISGVIMTGLLIISIPYFGQEIDYDLAEVLGYLSMIVALAPTIFIGIKSVRDKENSGKIKFFSAFKIGSLITLVTSVIYVTVWVTYLNTTDNNFMDSYSEYSIEKLKESGETAEVIAQKIEEIKEFSETYENPLFQIGITFLEVLPVGLLISLIGAGILMKK